MCGICGIIHFNEIPVDEIAISRMMKKQKHRGPDDDGIFIENNVGFGFVRLSIIDLSPAGHQPMVSEGGQYVIVFNGEIYNYIEIRAELQKKGYLFRTHNDTEVLLTAYREWGEKCLQRFNGMWAFMIYDKETKNLFAARDRFGVKPFYYYSDQDKFIFASEIPPILEVWNHKAEPDNEVIFDYLVFNRTDQTELTFFKGIKKLQHGHSLSIKNSQLSINKWYDLRSNLKEPFKSPDEYRELLSSAIGLRLRSDVPVGVCLSGGLDSSSIVSTLLADHNKKDINTFSAIYRSDQTADESKFIDEYKGQLKNMFYITPTSETLIHDLPDFIKAHAEPMPRTGPYAQFKIMELAHQQVVVTLGGQGADEQLAGYHYFFGFYFKELLKKGSLVKLTSEILHYLRIHCSSIGLTCFLFFLLPEKRRTAIMANEKGYLDPQFVRKHIKTNNSISGNIYGSSTLHDALLNHF